MRDSFSAAYPPPGRTTSSRHLVRIRANAKTLVGLATLLAIPALSAARDWEPTSYEKRFEEPKQGVRLEDNNVWVYTRVFAERFGMPARWINENLRGVEAAAYRVEAPNIRYCGYFGEADNCRTDLVCVFDLYLSDEVSRKLPWKSDRVVDYAKEDSSVPFLSAQSRSDQKGWIEEEQRYDRSRLNIGLDTLSWVSGPPKGEKVYSESSDGVRVMAYDREIFEGLDYIKLNLDCGIGTEAQKVRIFFHEKFPAPRDYGFRTTGKALKASSEDEERFQNARRTWFAKDSKGNVPHKVSLPNEYMNRINEYDLAEYSPNSLATEVLGAPAEDTKADGVTPGR